MEKVMISSGQRNFIIEGNIGAGKSTFLRLIADRLPVQIVYEPHTKWQNVDQKENLLEKFYKDTKRWAYTFQSYAFITRVIEQQQKARENKFGIQVLERSVYSDRYCFAKNCFETGLMTELEWNLYCEWFEWLVELYATRPTGFIYLQSSPDVSFDRIKMRGRQEESSVPYSYLEQLHTKHQDWLIEKKGVAPYLVDTPVLVLNCDQDFENNPELLNAHITEIARFIGVTPIVTTKNTIQASCHL